MSGLERAVGPRASFLSPMMLKVGDNRPLPSMLLRGRSCDWNCSRKRSVVPQQSPHVLTPRTRSCKNGPATSPPCEVAYSIRHEHARQQATCGIKLATAGDSPTACGRIDLPLRTSPTAPTRTCTTDMPTRGSPQRPRTERSRAHPMSIRPVTLRSVSERGTMWPMIRWTCAHVEGANPTGRRSEQPARRAVKHAHS